MRLTGWIVAAGVFAAVPAVSAAPAKPAAKPAAAAADPEAKVKALEAKLAKSPKDAKLKLQVAEANFQAGYFLEYKKAGLSPREKYRGALKAYRRALALNPGHAKAAKEKQQIEDVYKSMGMPVPQ